MVRGLWALGILAAVVGFGVLSSEPDESNLGVVLLAVAGVSLLVAIIATGVELGQRDD